MSNSKTSFSITVTLHTSGDVTFQAEEQHIFIKNIAIAPYVETFGPVLSAEDEARVRLMALHIVLCKAADRIKASMDKELKHSVDINMNPTEGETN